MKKLTEHISLELYKSITSISFLDHKEENVSISEDHQTNGAPNCTALRWV